MARLWAVAWVWISLSASAGTFQVGFNQALRLGIQSDQTVQAGLAPYCQVWFSTLLPKERTTSGDYETVRRRRHEVNDWIRQQAWIIDFEAVLAQPDDVDHFLPGLGEDGIHPSIAGQQVMGREVARLRRLNPLARCKPMGGPRSWSEPLGSEMRRISLDPAEISSEEQNERSAPGSHPA